MTPGIAERRPMGDFPWVMKQESAGLLMYRKGGTEVLLSHPGGPFWAAKDEGAWSIPKGVVGASEEQLAAAIREFAEETAIKPAGPFVPLGTIQMKSGKRIHAWAFAGDCEPATLRSNFFTLEWPPGSGKQVQFPEVDQSAFFTLSEARAKINSSQEQFLERWMALLESTPGLAQSSAKF